MKKLLVLAGSMLLASQAALAAANPDGLVKMRQKYMEAIGGHMATIGGAMQANLGKPDLIKTQAEALSAATKNLLDVFPAGSLTKKSHAKAEIWKNWKDFSTKAENVQKATAAFAVAASGKDAKAIMAAYKKVGESCKSCHKQYKMPEH